MSPRTVRIGWVVSVLGIVLLFGCGGTSGSGGGASGSTSDFDGDGVADLEDEFPTDATESADFDGDHVGDNADEDDDNDGVSDTADAFPRDASESRDTDGDGLGDNADPDDDGDGVSDAQDLFPTDPTESQDTDGDGVGDNADDDIPPDDDEPNDNANPPDDESFTAPPNPLGGEPGASVSTISEGDAAAFQSGKTIFEKTFTTVEGLGPVRTGERCLLCHNTPVTGGSGANQNFRFVGAGVGGIDLFVMRNAPPLYGSGFFDQISDEEILSRQDLTDADGDGISGRANIEVDRVGRYGLKAQAATLESITRGMLVNQLGITSDPVSGSLSRATPRRTILQRFLNAFSLATPAYAQISPPSTGGDPEGDDAVPDPEITNGDLVVLIAYLANLATPLRGTVNADVAAGEALFAAYGCAACHVPMLTTREGVPIYPYSDLLLHDMGESLADGVIRGVATESEYRTAPLWGLAQSAPYLHDGRAATIDDAIRLHGGEAEAARNRFRAASDADQQNLLLFLESL